MRGVVAVVLALLATSETLASEAHRESGLSVKAVYGLAPENRVPMEDPQAVAGGPLPRVAWEAAHYLGCHFFSLPLAALEGRFEKDTRRGPPAEVSGGLPSDFAAAFERVGVKPQQISIWFGEATSSEARFHWLPEVPRNPASVLKIVTTAQALEQLGPGYRWTTRAWLRGETKAGTLVGDLVIEGGGDPRLRREDLHALLEQVRATGVRQIRGDIIIDRDAFALPAHDAGAFDGQPQRAYNVGADALLLNFAAQSVNVRADGGADSPQAWLEPTIDGITLDNQLRLTSGDCGDWRLRPTMQIVSDGPTTRVELRGDMPAACESASIDIAPLAGPEYTRRLLLQTWRELGGSVTGSVIDGHGRYGMQLIGKVESAPLADLIRDINRFSNNVMAEHVWLTAGAQSAGWPATRDKAVAATQKWLAPADSVALKDNEGSVATFTVAEFTEPRLLDSALIDSGSGLSRRTRISAEQLHAVLRRMAASPLFPEFAASLPIAGVDGTAARTRVQAHARLKTGSLNGVRAAAGYVRDRDGRWLSLVVLLEDAPDNSWRELLAWLVDRAAATDGPVP